ncbi:MAG: ribonuclease H-like domain-containing protein [Candidatus Caldatribacteriaceae bacterium]
MLTSTFCHIPTIGEKNERKIWEQGITTWEEALLFLPPHSPYPSLEYILKSFLFRSLHHLEREEVSFFAHHLPGRELWRIFPEFRRHVVFLDIETTGLNPPDDHITTITLFNGQEIKTFIYGINLQEFLREIVRYKIIITFSGKCFDVPFIERTLGTKLPHVHIDLRYVMRNLGFRGGLKACEKALGIDRGELKGVDGYMAVLLWQKYEEGCPEALETLLAYNIADTVNLEKLLVFAYNQKLSSFALPRPLLAEPSSEIAIPYKAHPEIIGEILYEKFRHLSQKGEHK